MPGLFCACVLKVCAVLVSVLGIRSGTSQDRIRRSYFGSGFLAGEDEGIIYFKMCGSDSFLLSLAVREADVFLKGFPFCSESV